MYDKSEKTFKIATIVLSVLLILVLGYVAFGKFVSWKDGKYTEIYKSGYNQGASDIISQVYQRTDSCGIVPLSVANNTRSIADVECINKAIQQQGQGQQNQTQ